MGSCVSTAVQGRSDAAIAEAAEQLLHLVQVGSPAGVNTTAQALVAQLDADGRLPLVLAHPIVKERGVSLLWAAAYSHDVELTLMLARAGARAAELENVYDALTAPFIDAAGLLIDDERLARLLLELHAAGVRVRGARCLSWASCTFARTGCLHCVRCMVEVIDTYVHETDSSGRTLLHAAAEGGQAHVCRYLLQHGWASSMHVLDRYHISPVGMCLFARSGTSSAAICDTLSVLLDEQSNARDIIAACGVCAGQQVSNNSVAHVLAMRTPERTRMLAYICAAVGESPAAPMAVPQGFAAGIRVVQALNIRVTHMDSFFESVYIPDPLRAGNVAIRVAVHVDALLDVQASIPDTLSHTSARRLLATWYNGGQLCRSETLRTWAWMRRMHANVHRARALRTVDGSRLRQSVQ